MIYPLYFVIPFHSPWILLGLWPMQFSRTGTWPTHAFSLRLIRIQGSCISLKKSGISVKNYVNQSFFILCSGVTKGRGGHFPRSCLNKISQLFYLLYLFISFIYYLLLLLFFFHKTLNVQAAPQRTQHLTSSKLQPHW